MATYPIDPDIRRIAARFGVDPKLIAAVVKAEGDIVKAIQWTFPNVKDKEQALEITCRSAAHALSDFVKAQSPEDFITFWAHRWAPVGASNDPTGLNKNWPVNVLKFWLSYTT